MTFDSYHWRRAVLSTPELERARGQVSATRDRASFGLLLRSNDMAAVGVAFDQYQYGEASSRWGSSNPFAEYQGEVAARAREILRGPPSLHSGGAQAGANHASALNALSNLAEPEDAELILRALELTSTPDLRCAATLAARRVLEKATAPNEQLIAALERIILDDGIASEDRTAALGPLAGASSDYATNVLLKVIRLPHLKLQAHAALHLLDRGGHRALVEEVARAWPADSPYPADEVLELLAEVPHPVAHDPPGEKG
jgi:hypothetical protein